MSLSDAYNEFHNLKLDKIAFYNSWVKCPTDHHDEAVLLFWNEAENKMACFSAVWPHEGWQEYAELEFVREHEPWSLPTEEWVYLGEL